MARNKVLVAGASGLVGQTAIRQFSHDLEWEVVGVSRRPPMAENERVSYVAVDLLDKEQCKKVFSQMSDVTHLVYAAVTENQDDLRGGWLDKEQMQRNLSMLQNLLEPLLSVAKNFQHMNLLQGGKRYGDFAGKGLDTVNRRELPRNQHDNFYFLQEDYMREQQIKSLQNGHEWHWTIQVPMLIIGDAVGSNLNAMLPLGVWGALKREAGLPLSYPGTGDQRPTQLIDSDLLAETMLWSATASGARDQIFNNTNGDVTSLVDLWPAIADELGMEVGPVEPVSLAEELPKHAEEWAKIVRKYDLVASEDLLTFLGASPTLTDGTLGFSRQSLSRSTPPAFGFSSTLALNQAGFHKWIDSENSVRKWFRRFQERRLLPPRA